MSTFLKTFAKSFRSKRLAVAFVAVAVFTGMSLGTVASAAPDYFAVEKPTSTSFCDGGSWKTRWHWNWDSWRPGKHRVWEPNWKRLGFDSKRQCYRYVSTEKPASREQCRNEWWSLGFKSRGHCFRYLRLHPGGGYGGGQNPQLPGDQNRAEDQGTEE